MLTDQNLIQPFDTTRWVIQAPQGRNLLVNAPTATLYFILAQAASIPAAAEAFNRRFETTLSTDEFTAIVSTNFGGYGLLRDDLTPAKPTMGAADLHLRVEFFPALLAGILAGPLRPLYEPRVFWKLAAGLVMLLLLGYTLSPTVPVPTGTGLWVALLLLYFSLVVHEFGHVAACIHAGVRHGGIGFGFYYFIFPVLYADITGIWLANREQRIIANLGGIFSQGLFAAALALAYLVTGYAPLRFAAGAVSITALWQLNPFVRRDGYWLLADLTNTPNLLAKANQALKLGLSSHGLGRVLATRGRALYDRRSALFAYGAANAALLIFFTGYICFRHGQLVLTFPLVIMALLKKLLSGSLRPADFTQAQFVVLAFYLVLGRSVVLAAGKYVQRRIVFRTTL